jgi:serine/threonine-protein kinase PpkA
VSSRTLDNDRPQADGYRIIKVIGHGGMSTVYLADQSSLGRKVALKVMLPEALADEVSRGRFENEAHTIARLQHPHIVGIHEVGRTRDGLPFYSMPYLSRGHLAQRNLRGDQPRVAGILRVLLQALDYAHVRGVVHRDVKAERTYCSTTTIVHNLPTSASPCGVAAIRASLRPA